MTALAFLVVALVLGVALYLGFLPAIVAHKRGHPQFLLIFLLVFFLGATLAGWVVALVWACSGFARDDGTRVPSVQLDTGDVLAIGFNVVVWPIALGMVLYAATA